MKGTIYEELVKRHEGEGMFPLAPGKNDGFLEWLEHWLTEEEAKFLLQLPLMHEMPAPLSSIAENAGMTEEDAQGMLETLMDKAMVLHTELEEFDIRGYTQGNWIFITECYLHRYVDVDNAGEIDIKLGRWLEDIKESDHLEEKANFFRVLPIAKAIEDTRGVISTPYASEIIEKADFIAVMRCLCRSSSHLVGEPCKYPLEVCFGFGDHARAYVERGFAREVTREWALETIKECEEMGLIHSTDNIEGVHSVLCNCCPCHCIPVTGFRKDKQVIRAARSNFVSSVNLEKCKGSGLCVDKCPYSAIELEDGKAKIKEDRCIGCGLCATVCPAEALSLKVRPRDKIDRFYKDIVEYAMELTR
ncbi:MAG: 4Fe-4S binding protein [Candidatus Hydrogenedentota bacterium]|nr:MAG: 4Fe-4S binding protein [Candidatus Hydrogenedentota bacterium]